MKRIMQRSYLIFFITLAFFAGVAFLAVKLVLGCNDWVSKPYNGHMASTSGLAQAGSIYDRNDNVMVYTDEKGKRVYNGDHDMRCSYLHVIGDNSLNISTAVQSMYRTELTGYNLIFGLGMPKSLKTNDDIRLTINQNANKAAYEALGGKKGACVVYNYKTGEILCSTSSLSYDPQDPPEITKDNEDEYSGVYLDNVVSSAYTPGSIFKIVTAASAIENIPDIYEQTFECTGAYEIEGDDITCEESHGVINFEEAFAHSCNVSFAKIAQQLGSEKLTKTAEELGFNKQFKMSNINVEKSVYDTKDANENQLAWSGIGQHTDLANPLHMAMMCGAIANDGTPKVPYLISNNTSILSKLGLTAGGETGEKMLSSDISSKVKDLMRTAANYYYNVRGLNIAGLDFCAKTGTAEVDKEKEPNAWFVGFTESEEHPYAFAAIVEEGGYGISAATPVVSAAISEIVNG